MLRLMLLVGISVVGCSMFLIVGRQCLTFRLPKTRPLWLMCSNSLLLSKLLQLHPTVLLMTLLHPEHSYCGGVGQHWSVHLQLHAASLMQCYLVFTIDPQHCCCTGLGASTRYLNLILKMIQTKCHGRFICGIVLQCNLKLSLVPNIVH